MPEETLPRLIMEPVTSCSCEAWVPLFRLRQATPEVRDVALIQEQAKALLPVMARFPGCFYAVSPWDIDEKRAKLMQQPNKTLVNAVPMECKVLAYRVVKLKVPAAVAGMVNEQQAGYLLDRVGDMRNHIQLRRIAKGAKASMLADCDELMAVVRQWKNNGEGAD